MRMRTCVCEHVRVRVPVPVMTGCLKRICLICRFLLVASCARVAGSTDCVVPVRYPTHPCSYEHMHVSTMHRPMAIMPTGVTLVKPAFALLNPMQRAPED